MVYIQKKKDILWGGATASSQYEGGYDVRKNHEQSFSGLEWSSHLYKKSRT